MNDEQLERDSDRDETKETTTFSIRLTEREREVLSQAAKLRGWTMTNLIKTAARDMAAYVVNTSTLRQVDFKVLARTVADQIFEERSGHVIDERGDPEPAALFESESDIPPYWDSAHPVPVVVSRLNRPYSFLAELKDGAKFGGTEFLTLVIQACEEISRRAQGSLPPPIDPSNL